VAASRRVTIEFLGDDRSASRTARNIDTTTSKLGDTFKKVGKFAAVGLAAGVAVAGKFMYDAAKAAAEDEASQAKLAETLKRNAGATDQQIASVENWISAQGRQLGVTDDELRPALQRLTEATGDVGQAQKLASLAMDVSAGTGKSLESVSVALMKAQNGQVSSLSRLGIETTKANGETISFHEAVKKMGDTFGGQAAAQANTLQGRMGRLKLMFDEAQESIGAKLLPVLTDLATWFMDEGLPAIRRFAADLREKLTPAFNAIVAWVKEHWPEIKKTIVSVMREVGETVASIVSIIRAIWAKWGDDIMRVIKIVWPYVRDTIKNALKIIKGVIQVVTGIIKGDWSQVWEGIRNIFSGVWDQIKNYLRTALKLIKVLIDSAWDAVKDLTKKAWDGIKDLFSRAWDGIKDLTGRAWDWLKDKIRDGINNWRELLRAGWDKIKDLFRDAWDKLKELHGQAVQWIIDKIKSIPDRLQNLPERLLHLGGQLIGRLKDGIVDKMKDIGSWVKDKIVDPIIDAVKKFFGISSPSKVMRGLGGHLIDGLIEGMSPGNWGDIAKKIFGGMQEAMAALAKKGLAPAIDLATGLDTSLYGDTLSNQQIGRRLLDAMGWGTYWPQFNALVMGESGWNNYAQNPTSSAYGIGQFLDSTWATVGYAKTSDAGLQIAAMLKYIAQSYGNPAAAYSAWLSRDPHWYGQGLHGAVFDRPTLIGVGDGMRPERVDVTPIGKRRGAGDGGIVININGALDPTAVGKQVQTILLKLKRNNGGRELGIA
jgi:TMP repeat-containing protein